MQRLRRGGLDARCNVGGDTVSGIEPSWTWDIFFIFYFSLFSHNSSIFLLYIFCVKGIGVVVLCFDVFLYFSSCSSIPTFFAPFSISLSILLFYLKIYHLPSCHRYSETNFLCGSFSLLSSSSSSIKPVSVLCFALSWFCFVLLSLDFVLCRGREMLAYLYISFLL